MTLTWNRVLLFIAVVLFLLATLVAGGIVSGSLGWAVPGGLTAFALAFLLPLSHRAIPVARHRRPRHPSTPCTGRRTGLP
jgi:putative effector of murein hydrolase LrgA (UPF0299 family)